jgi:hypothetical protein
MKLNRLFSRKINELFQAGQSHFFGRYGNEVDTYRQRNHEFEEDLDKFEAFYTHHIETAFHNQLNYPYDPVMGVL